MSGFRREGKIYLYEAVQELDECSDESIGFDSAIAIVSNLKHRRPATAAATVGSCNLQAAVEGPMMQVLEAGR